MHWRAFRSQLLFLALLCAAMGWVRQPRGGQAARLGLPADLRIALDEWRSVEDFDQDLAQFESVFWDAADTDSLRARLRRVSLRGRVVLEIGTGTGLLALCCLQAGAERVVATDINPAAIANAAYNADRLGLAARLETRLVSRDRPGAYAVLKPGERFDLILSNPPWEDGSPDRFADYAFYDPSFRLLRSMLAELPSRLRPGGRAWLAYGCVDAIRTVQRLAPEYGLRVTVLDERDLDALPNLFLPGMLLEVTPCGAASAPGLGGRSPGRADR